MSGGAVRAPDASPFLQGHFRSMAEQRGAARLGLWLFLASEVLFFGALLVAYAAFRANHADAFRAGHLLLDWRLGALNTVVLIVSSLTAAWSVRSARLGDQPRLRRLLAATMGLAALFLTVKAVEWASELGHGVGWGDAFHPDPALLAALPAALRQPPLPASLGTFFGVYFVLTGLHGLHVLAGAGLFAWLLGRARRGDLGPGYDAPVDAVALYWHLVDVIWIFLFPLLYLA